MKRKLSPQRLVAVLIALAVIALAIWVVFGLASGNIRSNDGAVDVELIPPSAPASPTN